MVSVSSDPVTMASCLPCRRTHASLPQCALLGQARLRAHPGRRGRALSLPPVAARSFNPPTTAPDQPYPGYPAAGSGLPRLPCRRIRRLLAPISRAAQQAAPHTDIVVLYPARLAASAPGWLQRLLFPPSPGRTPPTRSHLLGEQPLAVDTGAARWHHRHGLLLPDVRDGGGGRGAGQGAAARGSAAAERRALQVPGLPFCNKVRGGFKSSCVELRK